jgi:hypothetical protein
MPAFRHLLDRRPRAGRDPSAVVDETVVDAAGWAPAATVKMHVEAT